MLSSSPVRSQSPLSPVPVTLLDEQKDVSDIESVPDGCCQSLMNGIASIIQRIQEIWARIFSCCGCCETEEAVEQELPPVFSQLGAPIHFELVGPSTNDLAATPSSSSISSSSSSSSISSASAVMHPSKHISEMGTLMGFRMVVPNDTPFVPHKKMMYGFLLKDALQAALDYTFIKYALSSRQEVAALPLVASEPVRVVMKEGGFPYPHSDLDVKHWTVNFADRQLFGSCFEQVLGQGELQVVEHPAIYDLKLQLDTLDDQDTLGMLEGDEVALVEDVLRMGALDSLTPQPNGKILYDDDSFAQALGEDVAPKLTRFEHPHASNIVAMAAPRIPDESNNQPYRKEMLEHLFYSAYTAFAAVKEQSGYAHAIVHTGNWGCARGHSPACVALIQSAAAQLAGIELYYYPVDADSTASVERGLQLWERLVQQSDEGKWTIDQFLTHMANQAEIYGLLYQS